MDLGFSPVVLSDRYRTSRKLQALPRDFDRGPQDLAKRHPGPSEVHLPRPRHYAKQRGVPRPQLIAGCVQVSYDVAVWRAAMRMVCALQDAFVSTCYVYFSICRFNINKINRVGGANRNIDLEPLTTVTTQFEVVHNAITCRKITQVRDRLSFRVVGRLANGKTCAISIHRTG